MDRREMLIASAAAGASALLLRGASARQPQSRIVVDGLDTSVLNLELLDLLQKGRVDSVHLTPYEVGRYGAIHQFADEHSDRATVATTVSQIRSAKSAGKIAITLGMQHANTIERMLDKSAFGTYQALPPAVRAFYELGMRTLGICYNVANIFGGGCLDPQTPLTRVGRRLVETIHDLDIILDVGGHTGEQTSLDAIAISQGVPVVCTHTNVAALTPNVRATTDRVFEAIASTGGVIGLTAISDFQMRSRDNYKSHGPRSPQASLDVHLDQYDYLKRLVGADAVALGPDFVWGWGDDFDQSNEHSITFPPESLSDGGPVLMVEGFENISKLANLENGLRKRGWKQDELDKLLGGNWIRVYRQVWGA